MKRVNFFIVFLLSCYAIFAQESITKPSDLDTLWNQYFEKGDLSAITKIVGVLEWEDSFRQEINESLLTTENKETKSRLIDLLQEIGFEVNTSNNELSELVNIGAISFILLNDNQYGPLIKEVAGIVQSKKTTLDQMKILGAATWSLKSNCEQHLEVKQHILNIYDDLDSSAQFTLENVIIQQ